VRYPCHGYKLVDMRVAAFYLPNKKMEFATKAHYPAESKDKHSAYQDGSKNLSSTMIFLDPNNQKNHHDDVYYFKLTTIY